MAYHLNTTDIGAPETLPGGWLRTQLPQPTGCCQSDSITLDDGLRLIYTCYQPTCDVLEASSQQRERVALTLTVALQGASSTLADGRCYDFVAGHSTLTAFANVQGQRRFPPADMYGPIRQLRLVMEAPLLHQYGLAHVTLPAESGVQHVFFGPSSAAVQHWAATLVHLHACTGSRLHLHMAALGLLSEQIRVLSPVAATTDPLRERDQEKMQRARALLLQHYSEPLTLAYISRMVGTNECTLKRGFRICFGTTVYGMLTDIRMHKARELLDTGLSVSTVARQVGYRHARSFSAAFAKYFGR